MLPRLLIVDDEALARARLVMLLSDIASECPHVLLGEAADAQAALVMIAKQRPDIILLDAQMPGMSGVELARHLAAIPVAPVVIFVSAFDEFALKAFEVQALDYLLKPVRAARLAQAIQRAVSLGALQGQQQAQVPAVSSSQQPRQQRQHFSVPERGRVLLVPIAEVLYLKSEGKYVSLRTLVRSYLIEESLNSIEEELGGVFIRVHRNALVARQAIEGVERAPFGVDTDTDGGKICIERSDKAQETWQVIVRGLSERLPISRRQWPQVKLLVR